MTPGNWLALAAVGIPAFVALFIGVRNTTATKQTSNRSASLEEFDKLRIALRAELDGALRRISLLESDLNEERRKRERAEERARQLQNRVRQLEYVLREHAMPLPPEEES